MSKRIPENQRMDRDFLKEYVQSFIMAVANGDKADAESWINEIDGVLWCMQERIPE